MPHRTTLAALLALALAGCASGAAAPEAGGPAASGDPASPDAPAGPGIRAGWKSYKPPEKRGQLMSQVLLGESSREGKLLASGKYRMDNGKVVDDRTMAEFIEHVDHDTEFAKFAVKADIDAPPAGALAVAWIDRGEGFECVFLMPGAVNNSSTAGMPKAYQAVKMTIMYLHSQTPGASVKISTGWSGEELLNQKPGDTHR